MTNKRFLELPLAKQAKLCGISVDDDGAVKWFAGLSRRDRLALRLTQLDRGAMLLAADLGAEDQEQ